MSERIMPKGTDDDQKDVYRFSKLSKMLGLSSNDEPEEFKFPTTGLDEDYVPVDLDAILSHNKVINNKNRRARFGNRIDRVMGMLGLRGFFDTEEPRELDLIMDEVTGMPVKPEKFFHSERRSPAQELRQEYLTESYRVKKLLEQRVENDGNGIVFVTVGWKGGTAKTPTTVNGTLTLSWASGMTGEVTDGNPYNGGAHKLMDIERNGNSLYPELIKDPSLTETAVTAMSNLPRHKQANVYLSPSDSRNDRYEVVTTTGSLEYLNSMRNKFPIVGIDLCNNAKDPTSIAAIAEADVMLFPVNLLNPFAAGSALDNIINLADMSQEHLQKVRESSRIVFSGVAKTHSNVTIEHEIGRQYRDVLIESARERAHLDDKKEWAENPLLLLQHYGFAKLNKDGILDVDGDKIDFIAYSKLIDSYAPTSVLPEELGYRTANDYLLLWGKVLTETVLQDEHKRKALISKSLEMSNKRGDLSSEAAGQTEKSTETDSSPSSTGEDTEQELITRFTKLSPKERERALREMVLHNHNVATASSTPKDE